MSVRVPARSHASDVLVVRFIKALPDPPIPIRTVRMT
jgi:hypothetical protein